MSATKHLESATSAISWWRCSSTAQSVSSSLLVQGRPNTTVERDRSGGNAVSLIHSLVAPAHGVTYRHSILTENLLKWGLAGSSGSSGAMRLRQGKFEIDLLHPRPRLERQSLTGMVPKHLSTCRATMNSKYLVKRSTSFQGRV